MTNNLPDRKNTPWENVVISTMIAVWAISPVLLDYGFKAIRSNLDKAGWIQHSHDTPVWIEQEWLASEFRVCEMPGNLWGRLPKSAHLLCSSDDPRIEEGLLPAGFRDSLSLGESAQIVNGSWDNLDRHFHVLPVKYWGRINRKERLIFFWRCQRRANGLVCDAIN